MNKKLKTKDVAKMAGVTMSTVTWWVNNNRLKGKKIERPVSEGGDQYIFEEKDVLLFLQKKHKEYQNKLVKLQKKVESMEKSIVKLYDIPDVVSF